MDWMNNKIYFSSYVEILCVFDPVNFYYKVLVNTSGHGYPRSVVLDPISR